MGERTRVRITEVGKFHMVGVPVSSSESLFNSVGESMTSALNKLKSTIKHQARGNPEFVKRLTMVVIVLSATLAIFIKKFIGF